MKNKPNPFISFLTVVILLANIAAFSIIYLPGDFMSKFTDRDQTETQPPVVVSSDSVSKSDAAATPVVSETEVQVPEVVLTSLSGSDVAQLIDEIAEENRCIGMSVAVIKDGQVAFNYEHGFSDLKKKRELNSDTKFRIASLSKVYTSMLGMKLVEDGVVELDGDIGDALGYTARNPYFKKVPITLRMLLSHTSSIRDRSKYIFSSDIRFDLSDRDSFFQREPGTKHIYTNLGMGIAGALIEQVSGMQLTDFSNNAFLNGMDIDAAYNGSMLKDRENVADCILGAELKRSAEKLVQPHGDKEPGKNHTVGAGGLIISAVDYAKIMTLLINDGTYKDVSYLSPETVSAIHETQIECADYDQCIGIRRSDLVLENRTVYYHTGAAYGIFSLAIYDVTDKSGVVIFTTGSSARANDLGIRRSCIDTAEVIYRDVIESDISPVYSFKASEN